MSNETYITEGDYARRNNVARKQYPEVKGSKWAKLTTPKNLGNERS
jgi:hypothetical protein